MMSQSRIRIRPGGPEAVNLSDDVQAGDSFVQTDQVMAVPVGRFVAMARAVARLADEALVGGGIHSDRPGEGVLGRYAATGCAVRGSAEPVARGLYVDVDGDVWEHDEGGWRLLLQDGVVVDPVSHWDWTGGNVDEFGPFVFVAASA